MAWVAYRSSFAAVVVCLLLFVCFCLFLFLFVFCLLLLLVVVVVVVVVVVCVCVCVCVFWVCVWGGGVKSKGLPGTEENTLSTHYKEPFLDRFKPAECQNYHNRNRLTETMRPRYGTADGQTNGLMPEMTMPGREQCIDGVSCPPVPVLDLA